MNSTPHWKKYLLPNVRVRTPCEKDLENFLRRVRESKALHHPWVYPPRTETEFLAYLDRLCGDSHKGYLVVDRDDQVIHGVVNVNEIVHGNFKSGYLGYYGFSGSTGNGFMRAGLAMAISDVFKNNALNRLEANIQPENQASRNLVKTLRFRLEGYSPRYLNIGGIWKDHERWAVTAVEWSGMTTIESSYEVVPVDRRFE